MDSQFAISTISILATALVATLVATAARTRDRNRSGRDANASDIIIARMGVVAETQTALLTSMQTQIKLMAETLGAHTTALGVIQTEQRNTDRSLRDIRGELTPMKLKMLDGA
jgi:hypothetical protein